MNHTQLDTLLHTLNRRELSYRDEHKEPVYENWSHLSRDGKDYYHMTAGRVDHDPFIFQFHPNIIISRHDRYVPVKPHLHDWIELSYMYSGSCDQVINGKTHISLKKGQMLILESGVPHSIGNTGEDDILINLLMDRGFFTDAFFNHFSQENILLKFLLNAISEKTAHDNYMLFHSENSERIELFMRELMIEFLSPPSENSVDIVDSLINLIFLELVGVYRSETICSEMKVGKNNVISILKYIENNYKTCTLTSVAEFFNMNPNYLSALLKKSIGYSFKELILHHRFAYVTMMLSNTKIPVDEIILAAGYENTTYFYKKFKETYGCSPRQYREKQAH